MAQQQKMGEVQQQQILAQYQQMRNEISQIAQKLTEFESDLHEHNLVIKTLEGVDPKRRCFRQVGDVLAERTVAEVLPAVTRNRDGIQDLTKKLEKEMQEKQKAEAAFAKKYQIEMKSPEEVMAKQQEQGQGSGTGVLV